MRDDGGDRPVDNDQQQARTDERGKERNDAEIPHLIGIHARDARGALGKDQRQQHAQRGHRAVGRDDECADVEENWMHLRQG